MKHFCAEQKQPSPDSDSKPIVEAEEWNGPDFKTCANASNVAKRFEIKGAH